MAGKTLTANSSTTTANKFLGANNDVLAVKSSASRKTAELGKNE